MHESSGSFVGLSLFTGADEIFVVDLTVTVFHVVGSGGDDHCSVCGWVFVHVCGQVGGWVSVGVGWWVDGWVSLSECAGKWVRGCARGNVQG